MCRACRLLPHGAYTLLPAVLSTMAWLASLAQDACDYVKVTGPVVEEITDNGDIPYLEVGFDGYRVPTFNDETSEWDTVYSGQCLGFDEDIVTMDGFWKAAKGFAFIAIVLGGGGALFLWFSSCFVFSPGTWRWAGYEVFLACFFQGMSFLWFRNELCQENNCSLFYGSKLDIVAASLWFTAALLIFCRYPAPAPKNDQDDERGTQDITEPEVVVTQDSPVTAVPLELPVDGDSNATMPDSEAGKGTQGRLEATKVPEGELS